MNQAEALRLRDAFINALRGDSDEFNNALSADDRQEIFLHILSGKSDLTRDLLNKLCVGFDVNSI